MNKHKTPLLHKILAIDKAERTKLYNSIKLVFDKLFADFQDSLFTFEGLICPIPKPMPIFSLELSSPASHILLGLQETNKLHNLTAQIISDSIFDNKKQGYCTITKSDKSIILGADNYNFSSLIGLSHELGHCLFERSIKSCGSFCELLFSELAAHMAEYHYIKVFIEKNCDGVLNNKSRSESLKQWDLYQRAIDLINIWSGLYSISQHEEENIYLPKVFDNKTLFLRESLEYDCEYQIIYALASIYRLNYLHEFSSLTKDVINICAIVLNNEHNEYHYCKY